MYILKISYKIMTKKINIIFLNDFINYKYFNKLKYKQVWEL